MKKQMFFAAVMSAVVAVCVSIYAFNSRPEAEVAAMEAPTAPMQQEMKPAEVAAAPAFEEIEVPPPELDIEDRDPAAASAPSAKLASKYALTSAQRNKLKAKKLSGAARTIAKKVKRIQSRSEENIRHLDGSYQAVMDPLSASVKPISMGLTFRTVQGKRGLRVRTTATVKNVKAQTAKLKNENSIGYIRHSGAEDSTIITLPNMGFLQLVYDESSRNWLGNYYKVDANGKAALFAQTRLVKI